MFRSLVRHIGDHNWFAVIVEFVLVVVGVLMGVLLAGAIERERIRNTGESYLDGLGTDYRVYQRLLVCRIDSATTISDGLGRLVSILDGEEMAGDDRDRILVALTYSHIAQPGLPIEGNTRALVSGALVETIRDAELRGLILAAQSTSTASVEQMRFIQNALLSVPRLDPFTQSTPLDPESADVSVRFAVSEFDLARMRDDPAVRDSLTTLVNIHHSAAFSDRILLGWVERVLTRLQTLGHIDEISRPENCQYAPPDA